MAELKLIKGHGNLFIGASTIPGLSRDYQFIDGEPTNVDDNDAKAIIGSSRGVNFEGKHQKLIKPPESVSKPVAISEEDQDNEYVAAVKQAMLNSKSAGAK